MLVGGHNVNDDIRIAIDPNLDQKVHEMPEIQVAATDVAERIATVARSTAPVQTGRYAAGIQVEDFKGGARVIATDQKSSWIEFGVPSQGQPARWTLRNAAASLGLKFRKGRR